MRMHACMTMRAHACMARGGRVMTNMHLRVTVRPVGYLYLSIYIYVYV